MNLNIWFQVIQDELISVSIILFYLIKLCVIAGDDCRVLMWSINNDVLSKKSEPRCLRHQHDAPIFTLAWDNENRRIFSGGYDRQVLIHDVET